MTARRRNFDPTTRANSLKQIAEAMLQHFGAPLTEIRYATYEFYNGTQWTMSYAWERRVNGIWQAENWLPTSHSTPSPR